MIFSEFDERRRQRAAGTSISKAISCLAAGLLPLALGPQAALAAEPRPNVILIITDDMGYGDLGSYGAKDVKTPNIDSLARDGVKMSDFYANAPVCSPTRAALITGRYQQRVAIETPLGTEGRQDTQGMRGVKASSNSFTNLLKDAGYNTALIGKWHIGYQPDMTPNAHGFEYFFGFKGGFVDFWQHTDGDGAPDLWENDRPIQRSGYLTDILADQTVQYINEHSDKPFYIQVAFNAPHWPYQRPDAPSVAVDNARHLEALDANTSTREDYVAMMENLDEGVGKILAALDNASIAENTLVIFTNDNGGEWLSDGGPLHHRKGTVWEGGIRVPALLRWPGRLPAGVVSPQVGVTMDLTRTILAVAGANVPPEARLDGMDLLPTLEGKAGLIERTLFWRAVQGRNQRAVRSGDWKLVLDQGDPLLYDLRQDVGERNDLSGRRSDIVQKLNSQLRSWEAEVDGEAEMNGTAAYNRPRPPGARPGPANPPGPANR